MKEWNNQMREAFDSIHAEDSLKESTKAFLAKQRSRSYHRSNPWMKAAAAAACMLVVMIGTLATGVYLRPVSVISIDINPSIELGINAFDRVVSVETYNEDARKLVQALPLRFQSCDEAVENLINSDAIQDLLQQEEELNLTVVGEDYRKTEKLRLLLEELVRDVNGARCYSAASGKVADAHRCGLSYGKYLAYLEALAKNAQLTPEDVREMTMKELRQLTGNGHGSGHHGNGNGNGSETVPKGTHGHSHNQTGSGSQKHKGKHH